MGLFDNYQTKQQTAVTLSPAEAIALAILIPVCADGYLSDEERNIINATINRSQTFRHYPTETAWRMFTRMAQLIGRIGVEDSFRLAAQNIPHELHDSVFALCVDLVLADGEVTDQEEHTIERIIRHFNINPSNARAIIDVMVLKNKI